jgi:hypothetical protein
MNSLATFSHVAFLGRAVDIADVCARVWQEPWAVIRTSREFQVVPAMFAKARHGVIVYITQPSPAS